MRSCFTNLDLTGNGAEEKKDEKGNGDDHEPSMSKILIVVACFDSFFHQHRVSIC